MMEELEELHRGKAGRPWRVSSHPPDGTAGAAASGSAARVDDGDAETGDWQPT